MKVFLVHFTHHICVVGGYLSGEEAAVAAERFLKDTSTSWNEITVPFVLEKEVDSW